MSRKITPWLLAASVFLSGATGLLADNPAYAITSVDELRDVDSSHWAYDALADLVEKYDVIEGYPDYTFKGNRRPTRWELAAALNSLLKAVGRDLARLGAEKANKSDLATLARLQEEFRNELAALNARVTALEGRASVIEAKNAEQDNRLDLLEKTQLHGDVSFGFLADMSGNGLGGEMLDGISSIGRIRLGMQVPVIESYDDSSIGEGDIIARLVGAFGRVGPIGEVGAGGTDMTISGYSAIAGGASAFNEGVVTDSISAGVTTGLNNRQNLFVESAYYKQHFKTGIPGLTSWWFTDDDRYSTTADLYTGIVPWRNLFNRSPYRGDELNQFQNTALVNNQGMLANNILPTIAMAWHQGLGDHWSADFTAALSSMDTSDFFNGWMITEELSINYDTYFLGDQYTKPGNIYFGGYHIMADGNSSLRTLVGVVRNRDREPILFSDAGQDGVNAFYVGWNQEWWRGIGTSVDYVLNETGGNNVLINSLRNGTGSNAAFLTRGGRATGIAQALSAVVTIPLTAFDQDLTSRAKDVIGVGYSFIDPTETGDGAGNANFDSSNENIVETFYRWAVNDSVTIIPSFQAIFNRFGVGQNDTAFAVGVRSNFVF